MPCSGYAASCGANPNLKKNDFEFQQKLGNLIIKHSQSRVLVLIIVLVKSGGRSKFVVLLLSKQVKNGSKIKVVPF